jgi:hypothetical protein
MASTSKTAESLYLFEREEGCTSVEDVELEPLSWRSDPEKNHSDWTIKIVCGDGSQSSTAVPTSYHVHKAVMGVGPRRCKYFSTLFQTQANVPEKKHSTSIISLAEPYANAFPMLLDFCYEFPGSQNLLIDSATNAMALRNIANYFGCDALRKYVNLFIENDIASSHSEKGPLYWTLAAMHDDVVLAESAKRICAEHVEELEDEDILQLPMDLFRQLVLSPHLECHSEALGWIVADFLQRHLDKITVELVVELTNPEILPHIDHEEAVAFFTVLRHLRLNPAEWVELESLCHRCGMGLAREMEWTSWNVEEERRTLWNRWSLKMNKSDANELPSSMNEEQVDSPVKPRLLPDDPLDNFEHNFIMSMERSLWAEVFIFISRLTSSLVEAQRVYHSELLTEQQDLQMQNQLLQAQVVAQQQQLQQVNHRQCRKLHHDVQHFPTSNNTKLSRTMCQPELTVSRCSGNRSNTKSCFQGTALDREARSNDRLRQVEAELDFPTSR